MENCRKTALKRARTAAECREQKPADHPANSRRLSPPAALRAERAERSRGKSPTPKRRGGRQREAQDSPHSKGCLPTAPPFGSRAEWLPKEQSGQDRGDRFRRLPPTSKKQPAGPLFPSAHQKGHSAKKQRRMGRPPGAKRCTPLPLSLPRTIAQPEEHRRIALLRAREGAFASACTPFLKAKGRAGSRRWAGTSLFLKRALLLCPLPLPPGNRATRENRAPPSLSPTRKKPPATGGPGANF